ncbi:hypothetical protein [Lentzea waywayandensis]|uniref:hypothetical protein n=1 Tax=Lentzea waywayandensis TaxID=84724 RepID=UPI0011602319|nr:hypothetical protein [Lentzea waywayandensis]
MTEWGMLLAAAAPGFPSAHNPLAQWGMRLPASRLGSTLLVSNLGVVEGISAPGASFPRRAAGRASRSAW